jgi:hypothetical protein
MTQKFEGIFLQFCEKYFGKKILCFKFPDFSKIIREQKKQKCEKMLSSFLLEHILMLPNFAK